MHKEFAKYYIKWNVTMCFFLSHLMGISVGVGHADSSQKNSSVHVCFQRWLHGDTRSARIPAPKRREDKIWFDKIDKIEDKISLSSLGRIHLCDKYGNDTGHHCVIFFRTLVLKSDLSGHLADGSTWVTICCDHSASAIAVSSVCSLCLFCCLK